MTVTVTSGPTPEAEVALTDETIEFQTPSQLQRAAQTHLMLSLTHGRKLRNNSRYETVLRGHEKIMSFLASRPF